MKVDFQVEVVWYVTCQCGRSHEIALKKAADQFFCVCGMNYEFETKNKFTFDFTEMVFPNVVVRGTPHSQVEEEQ